jgi:hypothetical protein
MCERVLSIRIEDIDQDIRGEVFYWSFPGSILSHIDELLVLKRRRTFLRNLV